MKYLPWDKEEDISCSQQLISSTVHEWYDAKHRNTSAEETELINSIPLSSCRLCGSNRIKQNGNYNTSGIKRYYCNDCHHSFCALTGTIFEDICLSFIPLPQHQGITEMHILPADTGCIRYLLYSGHSRITLFWKEESILMKPSLQSSNQRKPEKRMAGNTEVSPGTNSV